MREPSASLDASPTPGRRGADAFQSGVATPPEGRSPPSEGVSSPVSSPYDCGSTPLSRPYPRASSPVAPSFGPAPDPHSPGAGSPSSPSPARIDAFARDLSDHEAAAIATAWDWLEACGSADRLYETLFVPAAMRLGEWWESDTICFATVTLGMATLQRLLWSVGRAVPTAPAAGRQARLLLAPVPGQQHTFGLNLLCEQLRARGGRPVLLACPTREELLAAVRFGGFEAVGLSVGCDDHLHGLPALTAAVREAAGKPLRLLLGGPLAGKLSQLAERYGVDEVVTEAPVERLCALLFQSEAQRKDAAAA